MRKPNNWESVKPASGSYVKENLPAGGYEAKIFNAKISTNSNGNESLVLNVDVVAGEYTNFFKKDYDSNPFDNKKWRGTVYIACPLDDGSEKDEYTKSRFKAMTEAVEKSNSNYRWNWDENTLKGLKVGILVRDKEYDYKGYHGFTSEIFAFTDIQTIRSGNFTTPKPRLLSAENNGTITENTTAQNTAPASSESADDDYPF